MSCTESREARATSLLAEFMRNGVLDAQTFANHFNLGPVTNMETRFYEDVIHFNFTLEASDEQ